MPFRQKPYFSGAWNIAKKLVVLAVILLVVEFAYYSQTTASPFEESAFYIVLFTLLVNSGSIYQLYKKLN